MAEVTYYFNSRWTGNWTNPDNMIDGDIDLPSTLFCSICKSPLDGNTCPGTDLGTITKVEVRAYRYGDGDDGLQVFVNYFGSVYMSTGLSTPGTSPAWGPWRNITSKFGAPSPWTWGDVITVDCKVEKRTRARGRPLYCAKVEIRVTSTPSAGYYHCLKVQGEGELALCDVGTNTLRVRKGGVTYGLELVATDDPNASRLRIETGVGIKAIRKYTV